MILHDSKTLFFKEYDGESLYDVGRDISEAFDEKYNPAIGNIPQDENGFQRGKFTVIVVWKDED